MEDIIGKIVENYRIISVLGRGGMGVVYKAFDTKLDRNVAIKMLNPRNVDKERFIERFKREARNQAKLSHPNIVTVYGFIEYHDFLGIVMEYVEGESLEKVIDRQRRLNLYDVIYIAKQLLLALSYAHSKGFIHRDIKPSNIIFSNEGVTKIMDFGISKSLFDKEFTKTGAKVGTIYYMSPEQVRGEDVTHHSDIYSLGCTIYEMITGNPPFDSESEYDVMDMHLKKEIPKVADIIPGSPALLDNILQKMLAKNPSDRYSTCEEVFIDIQVLEKTVQQLHYDSSVKKLHKPAGKKVISIISFILFIAALLGLSYVAYVEVDALIRSKEFDKYKKLDIKSLFGSKEEEVKFRNVTALRSGVNLNLSSVYFITDKEGIALGDSGTALLTEDGGNNWKALALKYKTAFHAGYFFPNGKAFIVGDSSLILSSDNLFKTFTPTHIRGDYSFFKIKFVNSDNGFIIGSKGIILKSNDGGKNWLRVESGSQENLFDIQFINDNTGYICGWSGTVLKTTDGGNKWNGIEKFTTKYLKSIDFLDENVGLIVGGGGAIFRSGNGGKSWDAVDIKNYSSFQNVKYISDNYAFIVGTKGTALISTDTGFNWKSIDMNSFVNFTNISVNPGGAIFITGVNGSIFKLQ